MSQQQRRQPKVQAVQISLRDPAVFDGARDRDFAGPSRASQVVLGISLVLIAFNLRPVFSSLSALLPDIMASIGLSSERASYLTVLPVFCLGVFAPLAPLLARRFGPERTLLAALVALAVGTGLRGAASLPALWVGTGLAGASIAIGNVLLPGLVKRDFPDRAAMMTGLYTMGLCGGAAGAAGLTVPLERMLGGSWSWALACWSLPAALVALFWVPQIWTPRSVGGPAPADAAPADTAPVVRGLWRDRLAWQVTFFMGLQSALAYSVLGWLAPILRNRGMEAAEAGYVVSLSILFQVAASLLVPSLAARCKDQRGTCVVLAVTATAASLGELFAPLSTVWLWGAVLGIGQGGLFALALTLIVLRSPDAPVAAQLSAMAQGVGYVLAASGPLLIGVVYQWTGTYHATAFLFVALGAGVALSGLGAGRALHVSATARWSRHA